MQDVYLRREGNQYYLLTLGKNGDALGGKMLEVTATHKNNSMEPFSEMLMSDKNGKVGLGTLKDINNIAVTLIGGGRSYKWHIINQEKDSWTQQTEIHLVEGECFEIPVNYDDSEPLNETHASLVLYRNTTVIQNMFKRI